MVVANLENGRKRDLTTSEVLLLAAALRVPAIALLVDLEEPWAGMPVTLPDPLGEATVAEYLAATGSLADESGESVPGAAQTYAVVRHLRLLAHLEDALADWRVIQRLDSSEVDAAEVLAREGRVLRLARTLQLSSWNDGPRVPLRIQRRWADALAGARESRIAAEFLAPDLPDEHA